MRKPLSEILDELNDKNTHIRGLALEALAFKLMRIIDLNYVATRLRGAMTGGAEVDLIFESDRLVFSRWQIQCKNTSSVRLDDVAKEVGLMTYFGSKVAVIISTGSISRNAQKYAELVRNEHGKQVMLVKGKDIEDIVNRVKSFPQILESQIPFILTHAI